MAETPTSESAAPDAPPGIDIGHILPRRWHRHASPLAIVLLGLVVGAGLSGALGGQRNAVRLISGNAVQMRVDVPDRLRNGEFIEMRLDVRAVRAIGDLELVVPTSFWRDITINTMLPSPERESAEGRDLVFSYGPLAAGETMTIKIDGQVNPPLFAGTAGRIAFRDGGRVLVVHDARLTVLP